MKPYLTFGRFDATMESGGRMSYWYSMLGHADGLCGRNGKYTDPDAETLRELGRSTTIIAQEMQYFEGIPIT